MRIPGICAPWKITLACSLMICFLTLRYKCNCWPSRKAQDISKYLNKVNWEKLYCNNVFYSNGSPLVPTGCLWHQFNITFKCMQMTSMILCLEANCGRLSKGPFDLSSLKRPCYFASKALKIRLWIFSWNFSNLQYN